MYIIFLYIYPFSSPIDPGHTFSLLKFNRLNSQIVLSPPHPLPSSNGFQSYTQWCSRSHVVLGMNPGSQTCLVCTKVL